MIWRPGSGSGSTRQRGEGEGEEEEEGEEELEESLSTRTLEREIKCLSEEGSRQLEEQQRLIREQIHQERDQWLRGKTKY